MTIERVIEQRKQAISNSEDKKREEKEERQKRIKNKINERDKYWNDIEKYNFLQQKFPKKICDNLQTLSIKVIKSHFDKSLYLCGGIGTGKTLYACKIAEDTMKEYYKKGYKFSVEFIKVPKLLIMIRETYNLNKKEREDLDLSSEEKIIDYYTNCDLLILDDLGVEKQSAWVLQTLYTILDDRNDNYKHTIITSNLTLNDLPAAMEDGGRISSRIYEMCEVVDFGKKDLRKNNK